VLTDKTPASEAASLSITFAPLSRVAEFASRMTSVLEAVERSMIPVCVRSPAVSSVKMELAKVETGVQAPTLISPAVLLPIKTCAERILAKLAAVNCRSPVAPAIPIVRPLVAAFTKTVVAAPVSTAVPPTCELALKAIVSAVKLMRPVPKSREAAFKVKVPVPAFTLKLPEPELAEVEAATVTPLPVKVIVLFVLEILALIDKSPVLVSDIVPVPPVAVPLKVRAPVFEIVVAPPPA
jgi:hypothetical protein